MAQHGVREAVARFQFECDLGIVDRLLLLTQTPVDLGQPGMRVCVAGGFGHGLFKERQGGGQLVLTIESDGIG